MIAPNVEKDQSFSTSSAAFWDAICHQMQRRSYYVHPELGKYKQREFIRFFDQQLSRPFERSLKTDSFEEAFGSDRIIDWMVGRCRRVVAVDISPDIIVRARRNTDSPKVDWVSANIAQMPLGDASIDLIISTSTYGYLPELQRGLLEAYRILRPGGVFLAAVHNRQSFFFGSMARFFISRTVPFPLGLSFRPEVFREALERAGFRVECQRSVVHIFPFLMSLVRFLEATGNKRLLQWVLESLDAYSEQRTSWHYRTGWFLVFKAVKN